MRPFLTIIYVLLISCCTDKIEPDPCCDPPPPCKALPAPINHPCEMISGRVDGFKNCLPFTATAYSYVGDEEENLIGLGINTCEDWGTFLANKETLSVGAAAHSVGTYPFLRNQPQMFFVYYYIFQDHDVLEDVYWIDTTYSNIISITSIDTINDMVTGWFDCRFIVNSPGSGISPDTIIFTDCHFVAHEL